MNPDQSQLCNNVTGLYPRSDICPSTNQDPLGGIATGGVFGGAILLLLSIILVYASSPHWEYLTEYNLDRLTGREDMQVFGPERVGARESTTTATRLKTARA